MTEKPDLKKVQHLILQQILQGEIETLDLKKLSPILSENGEFIDWEFHLLETKGGQIGGQVGGQINLNELQIEIVKLIKLDPKINRKSLAEKLAINESAVSKHLKTLKEREIIKRIGGTRGHWEVSCEN